MKALITILLIVATLWFFLWQLPKEGWHVKTVENGEHQGYITAMETTGIWWKVKTVYIKTELSSSQEESYCLISTPEVESKLNTAMKEKTPITLVFQDYLIRGWANCEVNVIGIAVDAK